MSAHPFGRPTGPSESWLRFLYAHSEAGGLIGEVAARILLEETLRLRAIDPDSEAAVTVRAALGSAAAPITYVDLADTAIVDGICIDDCRHLDEASIGILRRRGWIWLTHLRVEREGFENCYPGGRILASDAETAAQIADARGLGEEVIGRLAEEVPA